MKKTGFLKKSCLILGLFSLLSGWLSLSQEKSDLSDQIDQLISRYHEYRMFNGTILVSKEGKVIFKKGYGMANMEWDIPNTPDTRFRLGSITKQFTAMLIMQLVEAGRIKLDGKLTNYLPHYRKDTGSKVTIHQLLTHTSGIPSFTGFKEFREKYERLHHSVKDFVKKFCSRDLEFEPDSTYRYSNSGYYLLGAIIEAVTGKKYEDVLQEKILKPLGMFHTGYDHHDVIIKKRASGYSRSIRSYQNARFIEMGLPFAAGAMYSTVEDLYKWDQALYTEKLLSKKYLDMMFTQHVKMGEGNNYYGYGWIIMKTPMGQIITSHGGGISGFNTVISRILENKHLVVILNNTRRARLSRMVKDISMMLFGIPPRMPQKPIVNDLYDIIKEKGVAIASQKYHQWKKQKGSDYDFSEGQLNRLGYVLMNENRLDDAINIFELNVEMYPDSFNPYDSLGEAYMKKGQNRLALKNYKKSVALNPNNQNGIDMIKKLEKKKTK